MRFKRRLRLERMFRGAFSQMHSPDSAECPGSGRLEGEMRTATATSCRRITAAAWNMPIDSVNSATVSTLTWVSTTCHDGASTWSVRPLAWSVLVCPYGPWPPQPGVETCAHLEPSTRLAECGWDLGVESSTGVCSQEQVNLARRATCSHLDGTVKGVQLGALVLP